MSDGDPIHIGKAVPTIQYDEPIGPTGPVVTEAEWGTLAHHLENGTDHPLLVDGIPVIVEPDPDSPRVVEFVSAGSPVAFGAAMDTLAVWEPIGLPGERAFGSVRRALWELYAVAERDVAVVNGRVRVRAEVGPGRLAVSITKESSDG